MYTQNNGREYLSNFLHHDYLFRFGLKESILPNSGAAARLLA